MRSPAHTKKPRSAGKPSTKKKPELHDEDELPRTILAVDIGGTSVKVLVSGEHEPIKMPSGRSMTPARLVESVLDAAKQWKFDAVSIGYPGLVGADGPHSEPANLGPGWVGFDFTAAFGKPVKVMNDAVSRPRHRPSLDPYSPRT